MAELVLQRKTLYPHATIGILFDHAGGHVCWTLEDKMREMPGKPVEEWKVKGETAIPVGTYQVMINRSPRFGKELPLLIGVPGFSGVRIHAGNTHEDTEGCILVGRRASADTVLESRFAMLGVMQLLEELLREEEVWLSVRNPL